MKGAPNETLLKDDTVWQATSAYINDVFINEDIASATMMRQHLVNFGLASKEPEQQQNGAQVFGLTVQEEGKILIWEWGPKHATGPYSTWHVLILWKASQALPSVNGTGWLQHSLGGERQRWQRIGMTKWQSRHKSAPRRPHARKVVCW